MIVKLVKISDYFDVVYGNRFDLNKMVQVKKNGINFVSRTSKNNGVMAKVKKIESATTNPSGSISVSLGGTYLLSSFLHDNEYYTAQNIMVLIPKIILSKIEKLYYCNCITSNRFRYSSHGREANKTLKDIEIPHKDEIPSYVYKYDLNKFDNVFEEAKKAKPLKLDTSDWKEFKIDDLFEVSLGKPHHKKEIEKYKLQNGKIAYVTRTTKNNGVEFLLEKSYLKTEEANAIIIGAEGFKAFYQNISFITGNKVNILRNKKLNIFNATFFNVILNMEIKLKFNYGRGLVKSRIELLKIKLPAIGNNPDWDFMANYIKKLPLGQNM